MRTVGKRKARNQPCKSPSPDVANRSIIKNTTIEMQEIKAKIREVESKKIHLPLQRGENSQQISQLNRSFQIKYKIFEEEMNKVQRQNTQLYHENRYLKEQNQRLKSEQNSNFHSTRLNPPLNNTGESLHDRILNLDEEKKILLQQISNLKYVNEQQERYIQSLQKENENQKLIFKDYEGKIVNISNSMVSFNHKLISKISELHSRINKLELLRKVINEKHSKIVTDSRIHHTPSSIKHDGKPKESTGSRNVSPQSMLFTYSPKPFLKQEDESTVLEENHFLKKEVISKQDEIQRLKLEKENFMMMFKNPQRSSLEYYQELQQIKRQNKHLRLSLDEKDHFDQTEKNKLLNIIEHQKILLKGYEGQLKGQQCEMCIFKNQEINHLKNVIENNQRQFSEELNKIELESRMKIKEYEKYLLDQEQMNRLKSEKEQLIYENIKRSQELSKLNQNLKFLENKLDLDEATKIFDQNYTIYREIDKNYSQQQQKNEIIFANLREQLYKKQEENTVLEKELSLKSKEVQLLQIQLSKVKELQRKYKSKNQDQKTQNILARSAKNREKIENNSRFRSNQLYLIDRIKENNEQLSFIRQNVLLFQQKIKTDESPKQNR